MYAEFWHQLGVLINAVEKALSQKLYKHDKHTLSIYKFFFDQIC